MVINSTGISGRPASLRRVHRSMALSEMRELMMQEVGEPCIEDVIFSNFLVQR